MAQGRIFDIGACLGRGGFGEVYRARMTAPTGFETEVALKVLRRDLDPGSQSVQRLRDEGRLLARLSHPAILRAFDLAVLEGRVTLVTEYIEGQDLGEVGPLAPRAALDVVARVAGALDTAWRSPLPNGETLQLVHRDIKPSNIRISRHGGVKVLDFGIARTDVVSREARTATDMMVGSPPYMAPERFLEGAVQLGSDVYALGASLYEALAGTRLFADQTVTMLAALAVHRDRHDKFVAQRLSGLDAPQAVIALVQQCLAYDVDARPTPAALEALADALADRVPGPALVRWARERNWPAPAPVSGELAGRRLEEGDAAALPVSAPPAPPAASVSPLAPGVSGAGAQPRRWLWFGGAVAGLGTAGAATLAVASAAIALGVWAGLRVWAPTEDGSPPAGLDALDAPAQLPAPLPAAVPAPPSASEPAPVAPSSVAPAPSQLPGPSSAPSLTPEPAPPPTPEATPARATVSVGLRGAVALTLSRAGATYPVPGEVPPGTYDAAVRWSAGDAAPVALRDPITIGGDAGALVLSCTSRFGRCNAE